MCDFGHIDKNNRPQMVDVSEKKETIRSATAQAEVWLPHVIREKFKDGEIHSKKGAVFQTAIIAGTMAVKNTSQIIPFCHQINIEGIKININLKGERALIQCKVNTYAKTGVEMEALVGVQVAALTIYDMCKSLGHNMRIENCRPIEKKGGKNDFKS